MQKTERDIQHVVTGELVDKSEFIRARLNDISQGDWVVAEEIDGVRAGRKTVVKVLRPEEEHYWNRSKRIVTVDQTRRHDDNFDGLAERNVHFIANAPEDISFLLERSDRLKALMEDYWKSYEYHSNEAAYEASRGRVMGSMYHSDVAVKVKSIYDELKEAFDGKN